MFRTSVTMVFSRFAVYRLSSSMLLSSGARPLPSPCRTVSALLEKSLISSGLSVCRTGLKTVEQFGDIEGRHGVLGGQVPH